ncbi:SMI1/KNR4 family protein [Streptomyces roseolus]|uniref:SMI1/KNR4 family protein n=1 Tax=Streptomyces roseolus TaxID=67358 RepID=UPI00364AE703
MKLLSLSGEALLKNPPAPETAFPGPVGEELAALLSERNGFYAFESALHVLPSGGGAGEPMTLEAWNAAGGWRRAYGSMDPGLLFFAEDVFGLQFGTDGRKVFSFNPESAETKRIASSLDEWARQVVEDYSYMTGYPIAHDWQVSHGALPAGHRLIPRVPFVAGGEFSVENMVLVESAAGMRYWGEFARAVAEIADGEQFRLDVAKVEGIRCLGDSPAGAQACACFVQG